MRSFRFVILLLLLLVAICGCKTKTKYFYSIPRLDTTIVAKKISINRLVREYKSLQGQYIETEGTCFLAFEDFAIYTNKKFFSNERDGFWMDINRDLKIPNEDWDKMEKTQGKKLTIKGRIDISRHGHLGGYLATITDIYYFKVK